MSSLLHPLGEPAPTDTHVPAVRYVGRSSVAGQDLYIGPNSAAVAEAERLRDFLDARRHASSGFATGCLQEPAAGKMFGVMVCRDGDGQLGTLRAFSGEWPARELPAGWVPPVGDVDYYAAERDATEAQIAELTRQIEALGAGPTDRSIRRQIEGLKTARSELSRTLTDRIHAAYRFENALGEVMQLTDVDTLGERPPTGTGDCCAPKLLQAAIRLGLEPLGMVEFWWGSPSAVHPRTEGVYYGSCREKCYPILGFLLRGIDAARVSTP